MEDTLEPYPDWLRPPVEGRIADDLDRLCDLPPHTELLFGSLIFSARQTCFHARTVSDLDRRLDEQVPAGWEVWCRMGVKLDGRNRPEPDLMVVDPATRLYGLTGIHHKQLKLDRPFPVDIDLT
ncbi:Uma2 family endonuclease [Kitasatospora sp. NPDC008115]|uniref:Uma2 family endonuclease n=1 Tax=Kitasatospora sp. NPDC008115 TaxID=3364022 RepID=UPI0036EC70DB